VERVLEAERPDTIVAESTYSRTLPYTFSVSLCVCVCGRMCACSAWR
jgi:hypothetical protein